MQSVGLGEMLPSVARYPVEPLPILHTQRRKSTLDGALNIATPSLVLWLEMALKLLWRQRQSGTVPLADWNMMAMTSDAEAIDAAVVAAVAAAAGGGVAGGAVWTRLVPHRVHHDDHDCDHVCGPDPEEDVEVFQIEQA